MYFTGLSKATDTENDAVEENPEFELSGYLEDASQEAIDDVADKIDPTNQEEMTRKTITGEQIDTRLMHIPFVKEPAGELNKFSRWEERPSYKSELKLVQSMKVSWDGDSLLANDLRASASILFSGNNFEKIAKLADFLELSFISKTTYYRAQRIYLIPALTEWWKWQQGEIFRGLQNKDLVVRGDGQCDSPGFTAKNLCYYLMEMTTSYIIDVEEMEERQVDMRSANMEKEALLKILRRLRDILHLVELVTDESASIKKTMETKFKDVFHSLDIWHKAKSIKKCISRREPRSGCERAKLKLFSIQSIVSSFVGVTDSRQKEATLPGPILKEIVSCSFLNKL
ncbi:unnamed protein product [Porites evermanni]|uniref:Uncharacterized protein n=1 Tax=Porites evermanni TaxID=104178 RepID=A0ABN8MF52_9CNID|nr:unnamed protein product [Porites evermanni]